MGRVNNLSLEEKEKREQLLSGFYRWQGASGSKSVMKYSQESGCSYEYLKRCIKWKGQRERIRALKESPGDKKLIKVATGSFSESSGLVRLAVGKLSIEVTRESSPENLTKILFTLERLGGL